MSPIEQLVDTLHTYQQLPHHHDSALAAVLADIQAWQRQRIYLANTPLFHDKHSNALAYYLVDRIYNYQAFDIIAAQLFTAGTNALNGSGKLEKLIPKTALQTGILGVRTAILTIELDVQLARAHIENTRTDTQPNTPPRISDAQMLTLYQHTRDAQARIEQLHHISHVCQLCYEQFNSFLLHKAFKLAKPVAYMNDYQPLYDFIGAGLSAIKNIQDIHSFTDSFVTAEIQTLKQLQLGQLPFLVRTDKP